MRRNGLGRLVESVQGRWLRTRLLVAFVLLFLLGWQLGSVRAAPEAPFTHQEILAAIRQVESSGRDHPPDGDGGRAIGPFQIHRAYWQDAELPGEYEDCRDPEYAELVVIAYMRRHVGDAWQRRDAEVIARTHNGGPEGRYKRSTERYWVKVHAELRRLRR